MASSASNITTLLVRWTDGDSRALEELMPLVYGELRRLARSHLRGESKQQTLSSTALVHEAYLRLVGWDNADWKNRAQFFAVAAEMMRQILVDRARERLSVKRGAGAIKISFDAIDLAAPDTPAALLAIDRVLTELESLDSRQSRIVELRFFGGLSIEETAEVLKISSATVKRSWTAARAWLYRELSSSK
jgi:RNA polymerase sigma factor (TIGR02999 family)